MKKKMNRRRRRMNKDTTRSRRRLKKWKKKLKSKRNRNEEQISCVYAVRTVYVRTHAGHCCYRFIQNRSSHRGAINWESDTKIPISTARTHTSTTMRFARAFAVLRRCEDSLAQQATADRKSPILFFHFIRYSALSHTLSLSLATHPICGASHSHFGVVSWKWFWFLLFRFILTWLWRIVEEMAMCSIWVVIDTDVKLNIN